MRNITAIICSVFILLCCINPACADEDNKELVILLHGIGHSQWNMAGIEFALEKEGYETLNIGYPSMDMNLDNLSQFLHKELAQKEVWESAYSQIHFTTHSMGGLVLRTYLNAYKDKLPDDKLGRVVMLAPPHGGSEVADLLKDFPPYQWIFGPAGQELSTANQTKIKTEIYYDLGIIAGDKEWPYIITAHIIPNESDGRVALEKTKLDAMKDHVTLSATHSFISWKPSVHKQIIYFIKHGAFHHAG